MSLGIVGDIHLGYSRKSYTTAEGKERYKKALYRQSLEIAEFLRGKDGIPRIAQVGDLFDKDKNDDSTLKQGTLACQMIDLVVAGNHDLVNVRGQESTLGLLDGLVQSHIAFPKYNTAVVHTYSELLEGVMVYAVPYCYTQELFDRSLNRAQELAFDEDRPCILLLHTNYNLEYELTDTTNNLTREKAKYLLKTFELIFSGHEHNASSHLGGKLIMTGSVMPVSLADCVDKFVYRVNSDLSVDKVLSWKAADHHHVYSTGGTLPDELPDGAQFVKVVGKIEAQHMPDVMKRITHWWKTCDTLLVCKPELEIIAKEGTVIKNSATPVSMVQRVRDVLAEPELVKKYDELLEEIG